MNGNKTGRKSHIAIYGKLRVKRTYCNNCHCRTIVTRKMEKLCCGGIYNESPEEYKVIVGKGLGRRRRPSVKTQKELLEKYNYSCCYCERRFDTFIKMDGSFKKIKLAWDHFLPFSYAYNHQDSNFLPACSICNAWKRNGIYQTIDEVKLYVNDKWEKSKAVSASL